MKINLSLFILTLFVFTGSFVSAADINMLVTNYGVQSNAINMEGLNEALDLLGTYGSYGDDANARAISAILRAQFSRDTTQADLGNSDTFRTMFPAYTAEIADLFKELVDPRTTVERRQEIGDLIVASQWVYGQLFYTQEFKPLITGKLVDDIKLRQDNGTTLATVAAIHESLPTEHPANLGDAVLQREKAKAALKRIGIVHG